MKKNPQILLPYFDLKDTHIKLILWLRKQLDFKLLAKRLKVLSSVALVNGTSNLKRIFFYIPRELDIFKNFIA